CCTPDLPGESVADEHDPTAHAGEIRLEAGVRSEADHPGELRRVERSCKLRTLRIEVQPEVTAAGSVPHPAEGLPEPARGRAGREDHGGWRHARRFSGAKILLPAFRQNLDD